MHSAYCFLLCSARNTASLPASVLGTLLHPMLSLEHCLLLCSEHCFILGKEAMFRAEHRSSVPSKEEDGTARNLGIWAMQSIHVCSELQRNYWKLGTWGFGLCSQYMCVPSCRDNRKLGTCLVCLVNLKLGTLVPISSVQAVVCKISFFVHYRRVGVQNWVKFGPRSC